MSILMAPAGNERSVYSAFESGADAVYFGIKGWSRRTSDFELEENELKRCLDYAKSTGKDIKPGNNTGNINAGKTGGIRIAAHRKDISSEYRLAFNKNKNNNQYDHDNGQQRQRPDHGSTEAAEIPGQTGGYVGPAVPASNQKSKPAGDIHGCQGCNNRRNFKTRDR